MGDVLGTIKIMPESPEVDLEALKEAIKAAIPEGTDFEKIEEEPIAFGLVALNVIVVVGDSEGGVEPAEAAFNKLDNIASVEVVDVRRLM
ncbi:MAG: elongation factor 1-beta [Methanobacteriaceae archaeon]|nr:elongation factor 1-beta [Methanobacteriaceae archaeon]